MPSENLPSLITSWKERLDLTRRETPELYEDPDEAAQSNHANAIRSILLDFSATAVFCVQGVPTVVIVCLDSYEERHIVDLHGMLWNQGLATLLLVLSDDMVRVFSLARKPYLDDANFVNKCMVKEINLVADALEARNLIYSVESGRFWEEHSSFFKPNERIDQVLLANLTQSHKDLSEEGLASENAQALLIQTMFIAYLEDREVIGSDYVRSASSGERGRLQEILEAGDTKSFYALFRCLKDDFNRDLFLAPCAFDPDEAKPRVTRAHLSTLAAFRSGQEEMVEGVSQLLFWGYNFKCIPVELVSAVYDRFLGSRTDESKKSGAYYTPMFLADTAIDIVWDTLDEATRSNGRFLDPACGSGLFLVKSFQRMCDNWRSTHKSATIRWNSLLHILSRLAGCDIDSGAVRVAVFSLYVALLEEVQPPDIRRLIGKGNLLPSLWDQSLCVQDFFDRTTEGPSYDVILGNPPWSSRRGFDRSAVEWCKRHFKPMPGQESAWGFAWKSLLHVSDGGIVGFVLPAMGFLHNHASTSVTARKRFISEVRVRLIINFADLRFQLFKRAVKPAALIIFGPSHEEPQKYRFDYWVPKADLNLRTHRVITLNSLDKKRVSSIEVDKDPFVFKRRFWMNEPESKLFHYLDSYPTLGSFIAEYKNVRRNIESFSDRWVIGNGFKPAFKKRLGESEYRLSLSKLLVMLPYMPIESFRPLSQNVTNFESFDDGLNGVVHRRGFERAFDGPRILVPQGISKESKRLRAMYLEEPLTFEHIVLGISVPKHETFRAKLLTSLLNSKLMLWYAFHVTGSFGSDRPIIHQEELLRLPFPDPTELNAESKDAARSLVTIIEEARDARRKDLLFEPEQELKFKELDELCYRYFGLSNEEITLVEDTVNEVIPSAQPHASNTIELCQPVTTSDREKYVQTLTECMKTWLVPQSVLDVVLEASNDDLALLRIEISESNTTRSDYSERHDPAIGDAIERLGRELNRKLPGNFRLMPDFRMFSGKRLWLVKPLQRRFWLPSTAIADADSLAVDLQGVINVSEVG